MQHPNEKEDASGLMIKNGFAQPRMESLAADGRTCSLAAAALT